MSAALGVASAIFVAFLAYWAKITRWIQNYIQLMKLPKMPFPYYPVVGHLMSLPDEPTVFFRTFIKASHEAAGIAKHKIAVFWVGMRANILILHPDSAEVFLKSTKNIKKSQNYDYLRPWIKDGLITSTGKKWNKRRKLITPSFHYDILKDFLCVMNEHTSVFVENIEKLVANDQPVDMQQLLSHLTLDILCETAMGHRLQVQKQKDEAYVQSVIDMNEYVHERTVYLMMKNETFFNMTSTGKKQKESVAVFRDFSREIIDKKMDEYRKNDNKAVVSKRKAFLDILMDAKTEDGKSLTAEDIQEEVDTFMFAGHGTATGVYTFAIYILGRYPDKQKKLQQELDQVFGGDRTCHITFDHIKDLHYLDLVVKEAMRLYPSDVFIGRKTDVPCEVDGMKIPEDTDVTINIYYIQRHPDVWDEPNKFIPERFEVENRMKANRSPYAYIPFSAGPRNCVAQRFAMQEEKVILAKFFRSFSVVSYDAEEDLKINSEISFQLDQKLSMKVTARST